MAMPERAESGRALDDLCDGIFSNPTSATSVEVIRSIIYLALSLEGLPPSTFDILMRLASKPLLGPRLLFNAQTVEVEPIMALAEGLPISWAIVPKEHWDTAAQAQFDTLITAMPSDLESCADAISRRRRD